MYFSCNKKKGEESSTLVLIAGWNIDQFPAVITPTINTTLQLYVSNPEFIIFIIFDKHGTICWKR